MSTQENINLYDLLNLSIRPPQKSEVDFSKLHALLKGVLKQLETLEKKTRCPDAHDEEQLTEEEKVERAASSSSPSSPTLSSGAAADGQGRLPSGIQTCEDGGSEVETTSKDMTFIQEQNKQNDDQLGEMKELRHQQKVVVAQAETVTVEKYCHRVDALEETLRSLRDAFQRSPDLAEVFKSVTWNIMQPAPLAGREGLQKDLVNSGIQDPSTHEPSHAQSPPRSPPMFGQTLRGETHTQPAAETASTPSRSQPQSPPNTGRSHVGPPLSPNTSGSHPETAEAVWNLSKLMERFSRLEALVTTLKEGKVDKSQLKHLRELIDSKGSLDESKNLTDQLNQQRALIEGLMSDREKLDALEEMVMNPTSSDSDSAPESVDPDSKAYHELKQQISYVRKSVNKLEEDMKQLKARQALIEESRTQEQLPHQLDVLRGRLENLIRSLNSQYSVGLQGEAGQNESDGRGLSQRKERSASASSTVDWQLQQEQTDDRAGTLLEGEASQIIELVSGLQEATLQLQAKCEKLHETTRCLQVDNTQKQSYIEELCKMTDELGEKKADKLMIQSALTTDQSALDSKVSRAQFDSETEQLNALFHELLNKVAGQEQDWHEVIKRLSTEMECKLNRIEFDPVKTELEDRWKKIHEKLQAQEAPDLDDAAALKKQLVDRYHCLSCDRPVVRNSLAPTLVDLPFLTSPPSHKSIWPFAFKPQEKFRHNNRSKQFSEMKDYGYLAVSRSCGGRGTVITRAMMFENLKKMRNARARTRQNLSAESEQDVAVGCSSRVYKEGLNEPASRNSETKRPTSFTKEDKVRCSPYPERSISPELANDSPLLHTHGTTVSRSGHF